MLILVYHIFSKTYSQRFINRGNEYKLRRFKSIYHYSVYDSKYFLYGNKRANDFNYLTFAHLFLIVIVILKMRGKKVTFSQPHCFIIQRHYKTEKEGNRVYKRCKRTQNNTSKDKYLMSMIRFYFCVYFAESLLFPTIGLNVTILLESGPMK